ncbi:hypothetical protein ACE1ET_20390 [Saccharicrinis sp. FJH62]|uniref:hypothetical protein n=1 Tax=Saccharicrinis sp. FJH62 TaxID=3344657 RepID=UPI0035D4AC60
MDYLGKHYGFDTYYLDLMGENYNDVLPKNNWFGFAIANNNFDNSETSTITKFLRHSIDRGILAFHGQGLYGGKIHLTLDLLITQMEVNENYSEIDITTTGDNDTDLANGFWECYGAACLPDRTDYDTVKLVCMSFDQTNYMKELISLLQRFKDGWLPPDVNENKK